MVALSPPAERLGRFSARLPDPRGHGAEQLTMVAGQLAAGAGNFTFAAVTARVLAPRAFAQLTTFLALYLLVNLPAGSIAASASLAPERADGLRRRVAFGSGAVGVAIMATSPVMSPVLHLPVLLLVVLGAATPSAGPLALARGRLYGRYRHPQLVLSMVAEPAVRLLLGIALAALTGAVGGAAAVTVAGYAALEIARRSRPPLGLVRPGRADPVPAVASDVALWSAGAFLLLAVVQNQDLILANRLLPAPAAASYGVLSTLGGLAAFATATIPLVLLPRAAAGLERRDATVVAAVAAGGIGGLAVLVALVAPGLLTTTLFGSRYAGVARYLAPYVGAMALLGVARVFVAQRCGLGAAKGAAAAVAAVATGQAAAIVTFGTSIGAVATATLGSTAVLILVLGGPPLAGHLLDLRRVGPPRRAHVTRTDGASRLTVLHRTTAAMRRPATLTVAGIALAGLVTRLVVPRGIWIDEATSIHDARLPFSAMVANLRNSDVHPPLYFAVLWATVRTSGSTAAWVMRLPSIVFGAFVPPAAYVTGRDIWDRRTGVVAAGLCGVAPLLVWYSQEARMYSMFMLLALVAVWAQLMALRSPRRRFWIVYVLASAGLIWTEYFGLLQVLTQQAIFVVVLWRRHGSGDRFDWLMRPYLMASATVAALCAPLIPFVVHQFQVNQASGKGFESAPSQVGAVGAPALSLYTVLANVIWAVVGYHSTATMAALGAMWPLGMLAALFLLGRRHRPETSAVLACIVVPAVIVTALGVVKPDLFDIRYLSGGVVLTTVLLARVITGTNRSVVVQIAACAGIVAVLGAGLVDEQVNGANPRRYDFQSALRRVNSRYHPGDSVLYSPMSLALVVQYYSPRASSGALSAGAVKALSPARGRDIFVVVTPALMHGDDKAIVDKDLRDLAQRDVLVDHFSQANVSVWQFREVYGTVPG